MMRTELWNSSISKRDFDFGADVFFPAPLHISSDEGTKLGSYFTSREFLILS